MTYSNIEYSANIEDIKICIYVARARTEEEKEEPLLNLTTHRHPYMELFVCVSGELSIATDTEAITLFAGDAVIIPADFPHHQIRSVSDWNSVAFTVQRCYKKNGGTLWKRFSLVCNRTQPYIIRKVSAFCKQIQELNETQAFAPSILPVLRFTTALAELMNAGHFQDQKSLEISRFTLPLDRTSKLETLLENHFAENITLTEMASKLFISPRQLSRIIKKQYGKTFHQVILEKRLKASAHLLITTQNSIEEIAWTVGYTNISAFYKGFSAYYNQTPKQYRKKAKN